MISISASPQRSSHSEFFQEYTSKDFDYSEFMRFESASSPLKSIYQSNGFMALLERGFAEQTVIIPAPVDDRPHNTSDRLAGVDIEAPILSIGTRQYSISDADKQTRVQYFADRTTYHVVFADGPIISVVVYPIFDQPAAVMRVKVEKTRAPVNVKWAVRGTGFQALQAGDKDVIAFGSERWPYRLLFSSWPTAKIENGAFAAEVKEGDEVAMIIALGGSYEKAHKTLKTVTGSADLFDQATLTAWNNYLSTVALVIPAERIRFTIGTTGQPESISAEELVRSQLWFWRGLLNTTCRVDYLPACPMPIADWNKFMGFWGNDGVAETMALSATIRKDLARAAILNWFRYAVNAHGDGTCPWTLFPSGRNTYQAKGKENQTESVPQQGMLVGTYVRLTGDKNILDEVIRRVGPPWPPLTSDRTPADREGRPGAAPTNRTLWQELVAYQRSLMKVRDCNEDHLIDWLHTYETGWDDKDSPFVDLNGTPTSAINEQVYNLWSLQEMIYLSKLRGEDPSEWQREFESGLNAVRTKLWDKTTQRYWDLNAQDNSLWTSGENLDGYYFLYFEPDKSRIAEMMKRLNDPRKFNGALLPTLSFDDENWGGYWRGPAWPRIFSYLGVALSRAGEGKLAFEWLSRAINSNLGPILPENVDPIAYPPREHIKGNVRIMGYDAIDCLAFPDVVGLRMWAGDDLVVAPDLSIGKLFVRGQRWNGDSYNALFDPSRPTLIWRNGKELKPLVGAGPWRAKKIGRGVSFDNLKKLQ